MLWSTLYILAFMVIRSNTWSAERGVSRSYGYPRVGSSANLTAVTAGYSKNSYFSDLSHLVSGYGSHQCYKIPENMTLCSGIGYDMMVLPNSLEHVKVEEVVEQSKVWVTLVRVDCHTELRVFLCSLYAPICIEDHKEKLIQPCRDLCESVRESCLPILSDFGLAWPDMLTCSKFPQGHTDLCIPSDKQKKSRCIGCVESPKYESVISSYCTSDVVVRSKVLEVRPLVTGSARNETHILRLHTRVKMLKQTSGRSISFANLVFRVDCDCPIINADVTKPKGSGRWLLMGKLSKDGKHVQVQHLSKVSKTNEGIRRAMRDIRQRSQLICQVKLGHPSSSRQIEMTTHQGFPVFQAQNTHNVKDSSSQPIASSISAADGVQRKERRRQQRRRQRYTLGQKRGTGRGRPGNERQQQQSRAAAREQISGGPTSAKITPVTAPYYQPVNDYPLEVEPHLWEISRQSYRPKPNSQWNNALPVMKKP